jgi:hypothetical protein
MKTDCAISAALLEKFFKNLCPLFKPVQLVIAPEVQAEFDEAEIRAALESHWCGEWGEWPVEGERAWLIGADLDCYYNTLDGHYLRIWTSADRSLTRVEAGDPYEEDLADKSR